jgi:hypothetical protein
MKQSVRRRAAALALAVSVPAGIGTLVTNTALLATTADGGQPVILPGGYPKPPVSKPGVTLPVPDPVPEPAYPPAD